MKTPPFLKQGDKISIVAPARKINISEIENAIRTFKTWGLKVVLGKNLFNSNNQFAGTDEERKSDFQNMLDDPSVKAIVAARGGYGSVRIIDKLDFSKFRENPKWIIGYSDITVFHSHIHSNFGIETLHAPMPISFSGEEKGIASVKSLRKAIFGEKISFSINNSEFNRNGITKGILCGGNLSMIYGLIGSPSDINTEGKILFLEDLDEYLYHIDRMMMNLKRSGKLYKLAGLVVGGMNDMNDNKIPFGKTAYEIISDIVADYNYPVCFNFPAGHINKNYALILGREVKLEVSDKVSLEFKS
ncbi:MAG: LD-carboxypeptidase [Saprospiraceae bacterium]|nr:LD-carboxypeptidase [Saprospiraceae bacterium]